MSKFWTETKILPPPTDEKDYLLIARRTLYNYYEYMIVYYKGIDSTFSDEDGVLVPEKDIAAWKAVPKFEGKSFYE